MIDEGGLAMVNVGDDGDVTDIFASNHTDKDSKLKGRAFSGTGSP
ncbi:hypothetical protein DB31_4989 [Hyalangium minutum]|uniref:Uncharacterized protein n=1 Tax=Hyalangium minutum TaxID=394096 RepID=A0A085WQI4_9BACT|nr:hypothetical protein DB31_4989 [Hyalangium minutum]